MKKVIVLLLITALCLCGCSKKEEVLEGFWMDETGSTLSFFSDGEVIVDGTSMRYDVQDEDNLSITSSGKTTKYIYTVKNDILTLENTNTNTATLFYRDKAKQNSIKKKLENEDSKQDEMAEDTAEKETENNENDTVSYNMYTNGRYGYCIYYPDFLIGQPEATNGDGRSFVSQDGTVTLSVWGTKTPMVFEEASTLDGFYDYEYQFLDYVPTYTAKGKNDFVFSGVKNGNIIYQKYILKTDGTANVLMIEYPVHLKEQYADIVTYISNSMSTGIGIDSTSAY